jgi:hypothetical protein
MEAQLSRLLDFSQPLDVAALDTVVKAFYMDNNKEVIVSSTHAGMTSMRRSECCDDVDRLRSALCRTPLAPWRAVRGVAS